MPTTTKTSDRDAVAKAAWRKPSEIRKALLSAGALAESWFEASDAYGWWITLRILAPFFVLIGSAPYLWDAVSPWTCLPIAFLLGVYGYKISFIMHDCSHDSLFRSRSQNRRVGVFCGWLVAAEYLEYKRVHRNHHRFNGTEGDPQIDEVAGFHGASKGRIIWHLTSALVGQRVLGYLAGYQTRSSWGQNSRPKLDPAWLAATAATQLAVAALASGFGQVIWLIALYPASAATFALFFARLRTFAEHIEPDSLEITDFTRTHRPTWLDAFLLYDAHFNYHLEHHLFPHMPSRHLPKLHAAHAETMHSELTLANSFFETALGRILEAHR